MTELRPQPFGVLVRRMLREARDEAKVFDLPLAKCFFGNETSPDLSVDFHGARAGTPLGPAAGPHSQMAQNILLAWLAGCRVMELKTVQVLDRLEIPRPCIDMATVGFNVEWSQELSLPESLEEYAKGSMLIEILRASGLVPEVVSLGNPSGDVIFDMSVGYDLAGVQSDSVQGFIKGMQDAGPMIERLRRSLLGPDMDDVLKANPWIAGIDFERKLSNTLTLSTFHGCPSTEIEGIATHLMEVNGLDVIVKLNPTLLGPERVHDLLVVQMGYGDLLVPDTAFSGDMKWDEMLGIIDLLGTRSCTLGRGFGVKFTNTLIVENNRSFFESSEKQMYLSGAPLHVLAMALVGDFRSVFGDRFPISFSAGIDRGNFTDAVAIGLVPVTVCTDLLRPGGYGRACKYFDTLHKRMEEVGARDINDFVILALGHGEEALLKAVGSDGPNLELGKRALATGGNLLAAVGPDLHRAWVSEACLLNTLDYVPRAIRDPRYGAAKNNRPPKKIGVELELFDCTTCDKCVPVCPNNANFIFELPRLDVPILKLRQGPQGWTSAEAGSLVIEKSKQYANFADLCNECGNCDVFCPEDGGPYVIKPRFFGTRADWLAHGDQNGFVLVDSGGAQEILGRIAGQGYSLAKSDGRVVFGGPGFDVNFRPDSILETLTGTCEPDSSIDLTYYHILAWVRDGVFGAKAANYLNSGSPF